ncbi:MAG: major capsid protein [Rhodoferax sp.]|uniref:major capsid protein n=1 Tax=Rhodoferax sp. TaxID=50421 RepID=UPI0026092330|nr:major capsid protein [Rhodoferax sp.]MDD5333646.1 major capsid protein [Rhodoferax sp.]MDD5333656.1 major capsid protein [Rhodoferax sp.]
MKKILGSLAFGAASLLGAPAFAVGTAIDVTGPVADITAQLAPVGLVGGAVLGVFVAVKAYHWVRRALS